MAAIGGVLHGVVETHTSISKSQAQLFAPDQLLLQHGPVHGTAVQHIGQCATVGFGA
jgi:hypothetical protein